MDVYLEGGDSIVSSGDANTLLTNTSVLGNTTPHLAFQLNRFQPGEPFANKRVPTTALFASRAFLDKIRCFYNTTLDLPVLISGLPGCGKLTTLLGMLPLCDAYVPSILDRMDSRIVNNLTQLKSLDENNFPKILIYANLYVCNIALLTNNTEIITYLEQIYKLARSRSIDASRKIFVICHIELCTHEHQRYITFMLDKINSTTSYILTTTHCNQIDKKIRTFCANLRFEYPSELEFVDIFKANFKSILEQKHITTYYMKKYWEIYKNNKWNIGRTIAQIKWLLSCQDISLERLKLDEYNNSLLNNIVANFIKKKMKLGVLEGALEIRRFVYTLLSINIDVVEFVQCLVRQLLTSRINTVSKYKILEKAGTFSACLPKMNKELIALETFLYELIYIVYSGGEDI
jgi:hypothetical protein